jgi:hypothetical protein
MRHINPIQRHPKRLCRTPPSFELQTQQTLRSPYILLQFLLIFRCPAVLVKERPSQPLLDIITPNSLDQGPSIPERYPLLWIRDRSQTFAEQLSPFLTRGSRWMGGWAL